MLEITETVLEMHYHKALMDLFRTTFGLGGQGELNFYKYSPQNETFVGFDQAYVKTDLGSAQFLSMMRDRAMNHQYQFHPDDCFMGYFLQFKVVHPMQVQNRHTPTAVTSIPHYRVSLDTHRKMKTGLSQHELLFNLNQNKGALVYYACPMVFDRSDLYSVNVDLDSLNLADLDTCPSDYPDNENHFIFFDRPNSAPIWCSDPKEGKSDTPKEFARKLVADLEKIDPGESRKKLYDMLTDVKYLGVSEATGKFWRSKFKEEKVDILDLTYDSLTIVRVRRK